MQVNHGRYADGAGGAVVDAGFGDGVDRERPDGDVTACQVGSSRVGHGGEERIRSFAKCAVVGNGLAGADMLGIKLGIADGPQHDGGGNAAKIGSEAAYVGCGRVVVDLVVSLAEHPRLGIQHTRAGQVCVISGDLGARGGVARRVEANAEIARRNRQAVAAAGDGHGTGGCARSGAVVVGAKDHIAGGDR